MLNYVKLTFVGAYLRSSSGHFCSWVWHTFIPAWNNSDIKWLTLMYTPSYPFTHQLQFQLICQNCMKRSPSMLKLLHLTSDQITFQISDLCLGQCFFSFCSPWHWARPRRASGAPISMLKQLYLTSNLTSDQIIFQISDLCLGQCFFPCCSLWH